MSDDSLKIRIWTNGDPSVGIPGESATLTIEGEFYKDYGPEIAEKLAKLFQREIFVDGFKVFAKVEEE